MAAPILLLPCRYVAPLALPAPKATARPGASAAATTATAGAITRATSVGAKIEVRSSSPATPAAAKPSRAPDSGPPPTSHPPAAAAAPASAPTAAATTSGGGSSRAPWDHEPPDPAPRAPVFRPRPAPRPREPLAPKAAPEAAHDLIIVPQSPSFRAAANGVMALVRFLQTSQLLAVRAQQDLPDGSLVLELAPDVFAHQLFFEGAAPAGAPVLIEGWLRTSPTPTATRFGAPPRESCFAFELLGCRFPALSEGMKARIHQILYLRPELVRADHDAARLQHQSPAPTVQPIPRCDILEIDDA